MHPVLFSLGPFKLYSYGLFVALGFLIAILLIEKEAGKRGIPSNKISSLCLIAFISGLAGARIMYVLTNLSCYREEPLEIFMIHHGGLMFHGGFIIGLIAVWLYLRRSKLPLFPTLDIIALYLPMGQAIGRIGCLLNGCCFGRETALPWAVALESETLTRHPAQLYESLGSIIIFIILRFVSRSRTTVSQRLHEGVIFSLYLILYPLSRIIVEEFRADLPAIWMGLSLTQLLSVLIFAGGIISMAISRRGQGI